MDSWQKLLEGEADEWRLLLEEEFEMKPIYDESLYCQECNAVISVQESKFNGNLCEECAIQNAADGEGEQVQDLIAVECAIQREWDALQAVPSYVERFKEEVMQEQPITIESDFMFVDHASQSCKDPVCPCRAEREVSVNLGRHMVAQYNREQTTLTITWKFPGESIALVLSPMETYRLLALLHAEMPASSS